MSGFDGVLLVISSVTLLATVVRGVADYWYYRKRLELERKKVKPRNNARKRWPRR